MTFGELFMVLREILQVGQVEMAALLEMSQGGVSKIERLEAAPSAEIFMRAVLLPKKIRPKARREQAEAAIKHFFTHYKGPETPGKKKSNLIRGDHGHRENAQHQGSGRNSRSELSHSGALAK